MKIEISIGSDVEKNVWILKVYERLVFAVCVGAHGLETFFLLAVVRGDEHLSEALVVPAAVCGLLQEVSEVRRKSPDGFF